jgi:hypothetical protein
MDLLTTYIHHSELQAITAPFLISAFHKSPQQPLILFPACCVNSRSLTTASNSGDYSASRAHVITVRRISRNWTLVNCQLNYRAISFQPPLQSLTNWVSEWRPFRVSLLVFSLQVDIQLTTELVKVKVKVTLQLAVYRQSIRPGVKPHWDPRPEIFLSTELFR